jgi:hypothetical protein
MPKDGSPLNPVIPWLIILLGSLSALAFVYFFIVPNCAGLPVRGRDTGSCGTKILVVYLCSALFLAAVVYSGYRLAGILAQGRQG